jgi:hypothetical protein
VNDTNFVASSTVNWNSVPLTTTYVSSTQLTTTVPSSDITTAGTVPITVVNPNQAGTTDPQTFTVNNPGPTLSTITPISATFGGAGFTLTLDGTDFLANSIVNWNDTPLTTTYVSDTELTATVPYTDLFIVGTVSVTVTNPTPGGGTSGSQTFTVNPTSSTTTGGGYISNYTPPPTTPTPTTCKPGDLFNTAAGQPCASSSVTCPVGALFSTTTGQPCTSYTSTPPATPPSCSIITTLRLGSKGGEVKCLQTILHISADGMFGLKTKAAVITFQKLHHLVPDGVVGGKTRGALEKS